MVRSAHHHQRLPMSLCSRSGAHRWRARCAGYSGTNYNPFGLPGDACGAQGACPIWHADGQMAGLVAAFAAAQAARESNRPLLEVFRDCLEISFQADDGLGRATKALIRAIRAQQLAERQAAVSASTTALRTTSQRLRRHAYRLQRRHPETDKSSRQASPTQP